MKKIGIFAAFFGIAHFAFAQSKFPIANVSVSQNGVALNNTFCGGLNTPVISEINLNDDEFPDLFLFDKYGSKVLPFINNGNTYPQYRYAPEYESAFPKLAGWAVIRDFNKDNVPDIFALNGNYIECFRGRKTNGVLHFDTLTSHLMFQQGQFNNAIWSFVNDLPGFADVNNDGDLDIMPFDVDGGQTMDYYENQSVELGYGADSLIFLNYSLCWGGVAESPTSNSLIIGACENLPNNSQPSSPYDRHQGGTMFTFDYDHDGDVDLIVGDVSYPTIIYIQNNGTPTTANFGYIDSTFPSYDIPVNMPIFPAAYPVGNSDFKDIWITPYNYDGSIGVSKDINNIQLYKNIHNTQFEKYTYAGDTFFVNQIFDAGSDSKAVFEDIDEDGKIDIIVGESAQYYNGSSTISKLYFLKNISTNDTLKFDLQDNFANSSSWNLIGVYPTFGDLDGDGLRDMLIGNNAGQLFFLKKQNGTNPFPSITTPQYFNLSVGNNARPFIFDVNNDGLNDILIGQKTGEISYFWNFGTPASPLFSADSVNSLFGGIRVNDYTHNILVGNASPFVKVENGTTYIYSGSERGMIFKYAINSDSLRSGTFAMIDSDYTQYNAGGRTTIDVEDINNDGFSEYLIGNLRGGIMLLSDTNLNAPTTIDNIYQNKNSIDIYPNPASSLIFINTEKSVKNAVFSIFDLAGKKVLSGKLNDEQQISVEQLANGTYILQLTNAQFSASQKFVVYK